MPTLHSHTHWQAPQADTQTKACQRVCLSHPKKKKLKIPFPSKNFKNANAQADRKTFGQLVAKLNNDKGCKTRTTRTPACNTGLAAMAGDVVNRRSVLLKIFVLNGQVSASNPLLHIHANRYLGLRTNGSQWNHGN
ncbi:MAG: hypothetical protein M9911_11600 [Saprospiraceae bacterium]|jgi:hypothetical protein|nr:hypothetical protein [Saprospiraceae bacterium]